MIPSDRNLRVLVEEEYILDEHQAALDWGNQGRAFSTGVSKSTHCLSNDGKESVQDAGCHVRVETRSGCAPSGRG